MLTPKRVAWILPDLRTEHNYEKACYEAAKYTISFILTSYTKGEKIWKFVLMYPLSGT